MIGLSYNVKGASELAGELGKFRLDALESEISTILDDMAREAANYPPELPGQRYVRTGDLGRGWTDGQNSIVSKSATMLEILRENSTPYGPYVQGAEDQAQVHVGRWATTNQIMDEWEDRVAQRIEDVVSRLLNVS